MKGRSPWAGIEIAVVVPDGWSSEEISDGLGELERIRRGVDAASARLVARLGTSGRDTEAAVSRATGRSGRAAAELVKAALVAEQIDGAADALASGAVSVEHLQALTLVTDAGDAAGLLALAAGQSPEEFVKTVTRFELDRDEARVRDRQRAARSVRFFTAEHGNVGLRAVLTPLEGAELKGVIDRLVDVAWREAHPDRAATLGGHGGLPLDQRRADALMQLALGLAAPRRDVVPPIAGQHGPRAERWAGSRAGGRAAGGRAAGSRAGRPNGVPLGNEDVPAQSESGTPVSGAGVSNDDLPGTDFRPIVGSRPSVVVVVDEQRLAASVVGTGPGSGPIALGDAVELAGRADLFAAVRAASGAIINFGRLRRNASPFQRLAITVRDSGRCVFPGCGVSHERCDLHHIVEFEHGGSTDLDNLALLCPRHHRHLHLNGLRLVRDGPAWAVTEIGQRGLLDTG